MAELKIYVSNSLSERFRRIAMSVYGYGRGSLSKAAEDAFSKWCEQHEKAAPALGVPSSEEKSSNVQETSTTPIDPEERPATLYGIDASENARVKSSS